MKRIITYVAAFACILALLCSLVGCSSVPLLKKGDFSSEYKHFIKHMQSELPASVAFEQYAKTEGFNEKKLITTTDSEQMTELVNALAAVKITEQVESASNFAVRYYRFTDAEGNEFVFEFFGEYLKCENRFYKTENSMPFVSIHISQQVSGDFLVALDEAHDGRGANYAKMYLSYRFLEQKDGKLQKSGFGDCELSPDAKIVAATAADAYQQAKSVSASQFYADFEQMKGQENANYIFNVHIEQGVILSLRYNAEESAKNELY